MKELRENIKLERDSMSDEEVMLKSKQIIERISSFSFFNQSNSTMFYYQKGNEANLNGLMNSLLNFQVKKVILPKTNKDDFSMKIYQINNLSEDLEEGAFEIMEPKKNCLEINKEEVDIVFVPGVAFDLAGNRLGHGLGYYDRFLKDFKGIKVGIAYDFQIVDSIKVKSHDVPVDYIITEKRIIKTNQNKKENKMRPLLSGKEVSERILIELKEKVKKLKDKPTLAIVSVGENSASKIYIKKKLKTAEKIGVKARHYKLNEETKESELLGLIEKLNKDENVDGFIVQLPLPKQINENKVIDSINPKKDVDGFHPINMGKIFLGLSDEEKDMIPATPYGIMKMIEHYNLDLEGKKAVIIGRSNIVGKPMAQLMLMKNATVTMAHSRTKDIAEHTKTADIIVVAVGKEKLLTAEMVKEGAIIIDVGMNRTEEGKIVGDVDFENVKEKTSFITPVPGGVGPMTVTMLLYNLVKAHTHNEESI
ncbi:5-formyltetrahydrofolate cyclo-ligase [Candidatus Woesearchaeota archaeon]|jgi:methylenetetrahydrofolate dehydrogenase (NADP+) / methenyltetrahydrofolate cyclohydrolase|nr:5-formyltetrahydrofolate cyclo-ligase [Candidatus Woesearchaeota archaeon]MBT5342140.1 5-formyltetrahydrofolate cyclo-ligase [Candidatus Woesearchaeota archaeon]